MASIIPLSDAIKTKVDAVAMPGTIALPYTFLNGWTWAEFAACLAAVYTLIRLVEWAVSRGLQFVQWVKGRRKPQAPGQRVDE